MAEPTPRERRLAAVRAKADIVWYMRSSELGAGDVAHIVLPRSLMDEMGWKPGHQITARAFKAWGTSKKKGAVLLEVE